MEGKHLWETNSERNCYQVCDWWIAKDIHAFRPNHSFPYMRKTLLIEWNEQWVACWLYACVHVCVSKSPMVQHGTCKCYLGPEPSAMDLILSTILSQLYDLKGHSCLYDLVYFFFLLKRSSYKKGLGSPCPLLPHNCSRWVGFIRLYRQYWGVSRR